MRYDTINICIITHDYMFIIKFSKFQSKLLQNCEEKRRGGK